MSKKHIFSTLFLFAFATALAQSGFEVGINTGISVSDINGNIIDRGAQGGFSPVIILREGDRKTSSLCYGIRATKYFSERISISLHINRMESGTEFNEIKTGTPPVFPPTFPSSEITVTNVVVETLSNELINIPILFNYSFGQKYQMMLSGGFYFNRITKSEYYRFLSSDSGLEPVTATVIYDLKPMINNSFLGGTIRVGGRLPVTERIFASLSGVFNHDFTFIDKKENRTDGTIKYSRMKASGIELSIAYSFKN